MYLVADDFVDDAIGTTEGLAEFVDVRRDCIETFERNAGAAAGIVFKRQDGTFDIVVSAQGIRNGERVGNVVSVFPLRSC